MIYPKAIVKAWEHGNAGQYDSTLNEHNLTEEQVLSLADALADPVAVFDNSIEEEGFSSRIVLVGMQVNNKEVMVVIHLDRRVGRGTEQIIGDLIPTAYERNNNDLFNELLEAGKLLYLDESRPPAWFSAPDTSQWVRKAALGGSYGANVLTKEALVNELSNNNGMTFSTVAPAKLPEFIREMAEIRAKAEAEGTFGLAPNGKKSNLSEDLWCAVRTKPFKAWFGDWKRKAELTLKTELMRDKDVQAYLKEHASGDIVNIETGIVGTISSRQRNKLISDPAKRYSAKSDFSSTQHNYVASRIKTLFEHALFVSEYKDKSGDVNVKSVKRFACPLMLDGRECIAFITAKETEGHKIYALELDNIEKLGGKLEQLEYLKPTPSAPSSESIIEKVRSTFKTYFEDVSKVVDENGEPKVVYHYTDEQFSAFDPAKARVNSDVQAIFFMDNAVDWQDMGERKMACFLNIRKPVEKPMVDARRNEAGKLMRDELIAQGYDGTFLTEDGATEWAAFYPNQIKSVDNRGTWSNVDNRITFSVIGGEMTAAQLRRMDAEYMAAVERGDMETAQRMVNEYARVRGYEPDDAERKMMHTAPSYVPGTKIEHERYGHVNAEDLAQGCDIVPTDYWTHPQYYQYEQEQRDAFYKVREFIEKTRAWQNGERGKPPMIALYRAVAKTREEKPRNGDWVSPSRDYAVNHGQREHGAGKYVIQMVKAKPNEVWWDGNDIAEWGYDDGKNYAYRNTANNRKLLDAVTYGYDGNVVPLSKRFNKREFGVSFSVVRRADKSLYVRADNKVTDTDTAYQVLWKKMLGMTERVGKTTQRQGIAGKGLVAPDTDYEVFIMKSGIEAMLSWNHVKNSVIVAPAEVHLTAASLVDELWLASSMMPERKNKRGEWQVGEQEGDKKNPKNVNLKMIHHRIADLVMPDGKMYEVKMTAKEFNSKNETNSLYMVEVEGIKEKSTGVGNETFASEEQILPRGPVDEVNVTQGEEVVKRGEGVSFSVIGRHAKTWGKYTDRAFAGRDDGLMRAEIDASVARVKRVEGSVDFETFRDMFGKVGGEEAVATLDEVVRLNKEIGTYNFSNNDEFFKAQSLGYEAHQLAKKLYRVYEEVMINLGVSRFSMDDLVGPDEYNKIRDAALRGTTDGLDFLISVNSRKLCRLGDILDYPELFEAYPELSKYRVRFDNLGAGTRGVYRHESKLFLVNEGDIGNDYAIRNTLLHEVQHAIQYIEGFAKGGSAVIFGNLYPRLAGEIEARNVQARANWTAEQRAATPFNDTLEYPGEAFVTFSVVDRAAIISRPEYREAVEKIDGVLYGYRSRESKSGLSHEFVPFMDVGDETEVKVRELCGRDVSGYKHSISESDVWHAIMRHERDSSDRRKGQLDVEEEDIRLLPDILKNCDEVEYQTPKGRPTLRYKKRYGDVVYYVVEVIGQRRRKHDSVLMFKTEWIQKEKAEARGSSPRIERSMSRNLSGDNMTDSSSDVNGISSSMVSSAEAVRTMMRRRADDVEGEELIKRWDFLMNKLEFVSEDKLSVDKQRDGAARLASIIALMESTKGILPPEYCRMGRLNMLIQWASVYAHLVNTGEVKRTGMMKGAIYRKFADAMQREYEAGLNRGLSYEDAKAVLQDMAEKRMDEQLLKVAQECRKRLDMFVKDRAYERIELMTERAYPKKEVGRRSPRGKMETRYYRGMNTMRKWMEADAGEIAKRVHGLREAIDEMEGEESPDGVRKDDLEEELRIIQMYGDWASMGSAQALKVAEDFTVYVTTARHLWDELLEREKRQRNWRKGLMQFKKPYTPNTRSDTKRETKSEKKHRFSFKSMLTNVMSYGQLMLAGRKVFGDEFCQARIQEIADANAGLRNARRERDDAFGYAVMAATGLTKESDVVGWLNKLAKVEDRTGVWLSEITNRTLEMSVSEAEEWVDMSEGQRKQRRAEIYEEAARKKELPSNIPKEEDIELIKAELERMKAQESEAEKVRVWAPEFGERVEKRLSRDAALNIILLLEQEDYHHLIEYSGFEPRDVNGNVIDREKDRSTPIDVEMTLKPLYDFVGEEALKFAYALRRYVGQNGRKMQAVYEAQMGIPLAMKPNYWRGNFNLNPIKEKDSLSEGNGSIGGGNAYGFLIDRVKHYNRLEWTNTVTEVFGITVETQNNYIYTSGITREWRGLLQGDFAHRMANELGKTYMDALKEWLDIIDGAGRNLGASLRGLKNWHARVGSGLALTALAGNGFVLAKQSSGILHGLLGGEVPLAAVERSTGVKELEWRKIGAAAYAAAFARTKAGFSKVSMKELMESEWFKARVDSEYKNVARRMSMSENQKGHVWSNMIQDKGMAAIELVDRGVNLLGMQALADEVYRCLDKINGEQNLNMSEEQIKREALKAVGRALSLSSQPHERSEKNLFAARGGMITNMLFQFKSETINKLGLMIARWMSGQQVVSIRDYMLFGAFNASVAAFITWLRYGGDDEDDTEWYQTAGRFILDVATGDLGAMPIVGDIINPIKAEITGDYYMSRGMVDSYSDALFFWEHLIKMYEGKKRGKDMDWHDYIAEVNAMNRKMGIVGSFLGEGATWVEVVLAVAAMGNVIRTGADVVNAATREE